MELRTGISLKLYTTMRLGGDARMMAPATTVDDVREIYRAAKAQQLPVFVLGGGSNVIAHDEGYNGVVLLNHLKGFDVVFDDGTIAVVKIGAGEVWDEVVKRTVDLGLSGIEAMSAIPGTAGAAPVQNVGAYGQEIADTFVELEAYDSLRDEVVKINAQQCEFSYRHSIFRGSAAGRYCILNITLKLFHLPPKPPFYAGLQQYLDDRHITTFTPQVIRDAVMAIRFDKLPDPVKHPNAGSFFKNSLIEPWQLKQLREDYPDMPCYDMPNGTCKVPTGWLIERAGYKGRELRGIRVHDKNALVLINESATSYQDLAAVRDEIIQAVYDKFHIRIEQEPLEI